jgi:hypothetical protein
VGQGSGQGRLDVVVSASGQGTWSKFVSWNQSLYRCCERATLSQVEPGCHGVAIGDGHRCGCLGWPTRGSSTEASNRCV